MDKHLSNLNGANQEIKRRLDVVKVITDDLGPPAKQTGQDHFWCCPFHNEATPSFSAHSSLQGYKCFGCKTGGDVIAWIQNYRSMSNPEAVQYLAAKYVIDISSFEQPLSPEQIQIQRYYSIMDEAAEYCNVQLLNNKQILQWYLNDCGFDIEKIIDYQVGYNSSNDAIIRHLYTKFPNLTQDDVDKLEFGNRLLWQDALVYPVKNASGHTARFHNKPLTPPADFGGKYVGNSHRHPLFSNKLIFGFSLLKKNIREVKYSLRICEGQKAAMASGGCAVLGSSLHETQIELLREHHIKEVRFAFDGDAAGRAASVRLLDQMHLMSDISVLVARVPDDKQPDDILKTDGKAALDKIYQEAAIPLRFYVDQYRGPTGEISIEDKFAVVRNIKDYLGSVSGVHLELSAQYLEEQLDISKEEIKSFASDLKITRSGLLNRDAETTVLNEVILNPKMWSTLRQVIDDPKAFTVPGYQYIFGALDSVHKKARDASGAESVTIQALKDELALRFPQFRELPQIIDSVLQGEVKYEFIDALKKLVDLYHRRVGIEQSRIFQSMMQDLGKDADKSITSFRRQLISCVELKQDSTSTPELLSSVVLHEIQDRMNLSGHVIGHDFSRLIDIDGQSIPCLTFLTLAMSGLQSGHEFIISANSGVGKSLMALQMAISISICPAPADQVPVLWIPLEMNAVETTMRIVSMLTGINNNLVQAGKFNAEQFFRVKKALDMIARSKFYIKKPRTGSIDEIYSIADEYRFKYGIMGMFTDYLQLMSPGESDRGLARHEVIGRASKVLKNQIAEDMKIFSVAISQQNRKDFKMGETGKIENVSGSYEISQDCDDFLILAEKTDEQMQKTPGNRQGFIDKRRGGQSDIRFDLELDVNQGITLRYVERVPPEQMMGLRRGVSL